MNIWYHPCKYNYIQPIAYIIFQKLLLSGFRAQKIDEGYFEKFCSLDWEVEAKEEELTKEIKERKVRSNISPITTVYACPTRKQKLPFSR